MGTPILRVRDENGNYIPIPAIKGEPGKDYVLTDEDKQEIANLVGNNKPAEKPTSEVILDSLEGTALVLDAINNSVAFYDAADSVPPDSCIKDIEFLYNGNYVSIKELYTADDLPGAYFYVMGKAHATNYGTFLCSINYGGMSKGKILKDFYDYETSTIRVTYYTD